MPPPAGAVTVDVVLEPAMGVSVVTGGEHDSGQPIEESGRCLGADRSTAADVAGADPHLWRGVNRRGLGRLTGTGYSQRQNADDAQASHGSTQRCRSSHEAVDSIGARRRGTTARCRWVSIAAVAGLLFAASLAAAQPPGGQTPPPVVELRFNDDRPTVRFGKVAQIDFRLKLQAELWRSDLPLTPDESQLGWTRRRIGVGGELAGVIGFEIEGDFAGDARWRDVFVNYQQFGAFQIQAGRFKLPFSLDQTTSIANIDFLYRSRAAELLAPGRDRGVMIHGRIARRIVTYEAGVFEHDGDNARRPNTDSRFRRPSHRRARLASSVPELEINGKDARRRIRDGQQ